MQCFCCFRVIFVKLFILEIMKKVILNVGMLLLAMGLLTACSSGNDVVEVPDQPKQEQPTIPRRTRMSRKPLIPKTAWWWICCLRPVPFN